MPNYSSDMKKYCKNSSTCRKDFLFKHFESDYNDVTANCDNVCCDICDV